MLPGESCLLSAPAEPGPCRPLTCSTGPESHALRSYPYSLLSNFHPVSAHLTWRAPHTWHSGLGSHFLGCCMPKITLDKDIKAVFTAQECAVGSCLATRRETSTRACGQFTGNRFPCGYRDWVPHSILTSVGLLHS